MGMERKSVEYFIEIMNERIQFLTDSINNFEKEIEAADGYAKGHFKGYNAARRSEIEFIQRRIEFLNKILEENNNSEEVVQKEQVFVYNRHKLHESRDHHGKS